MRDYELEAEGAIIMKEPSQEVDRLATEVIGAAIEVHKALGPGYLESVYEEALCVELGLRNIPYRNQAGFHLEYKDQKVGEGRLDLLVDEILVVELKVVDALAPIHTAQILSYLKALDIQLGLLINFNVAVLRDGLKRIIRS